MLVSTKGRYALRLVTRIAGSGGQGPVSLRTVATDEEISLKYLEQLARPLARAGILKSLRGKGGGYELAVPAERISAGDVLRAVEGSTSAVSCMALEEGGFCPREGRCTTVGFWAGLNRAVERYVDGVTVADLAKEFNAEQPADRPLSRELP